MSNAAKKIERVLSSVERLFSGLTGDEKTSSKTLAFIIEAKDALNDALVMAKIDAGATPEQAQGLPPGTLDALDPLSDS